MAEDGVMPQPREYNFPVWATQGGGLVREVSRNPYRYIFVEAPPKGMGLSVGDFMPEEWDLIPANKLARDIIEDEQFGDKSDEYESLRNLVQDMSLENGGDR
jgi:hypothetical protein